MDDKISALLEVLAAHRFDVMRTYFGPYDGDHYVIEPTQEALAFAKRIVPDATASDFYFPRGEDYGRLKVQAIERARKALENYKRVTVRRYERPTYSLEPEDEENPDA